MASKKDVGTGKWAHRANLTIDGVVHDEHGIPMSGKGSFGGKRNTAGFDINKQNAGRKPNSYKAIFDDFTDAGVEIPSKDDYKRMIGVIMTLGQADLKALNKSQGTPQWIKNLIVDFNKPSTRTRLMANYRDWLWGAAAREIKGEINHSLTQGYAIKGIDGQLKEI